MAKSISDIIEQFLISAIADRAELNISRSELAELFNCVPSQINYVLATRFNLNRGFIVQSRRGGGGYITLIRMPADSHGTLKSLIGGEFGDAISYSDALNILERMFYEDIITLSERDIIRAAVSDKDLPVPEPLRSNVRAVILKNIAVQLIKREN